MIQRFRQTELKKLFESGNSAGINPHRVKYLRQILALIETSDSIEDMDLPGLNLHERDQSGMCTVEVSGAGASHSRIKMKIFINGVSHGNV